MGLSADPEGDDAAIAFHDVSLVRTGAHVCHYAVKIHAFTSTSGGIKSGLDDLVTDGITDKTGD